MLNARGKLNIVFFSCERKIMLDYIINQSCDETRVVDVVQVGQAQRYGVLIELKTPGMIGLEGLKSFT